MKRVIDVPMDVSAFADDLRREDVGTVIRYYNHRNSSRLPTKRLERTEAEALADAGLKLATVFQQRGGAGGQIEDLDRDSGEADAARAVQLARDLGQPEGSAIYFAVDHDYFRQSELLKIRPYFEAVRSRLGGSYRVGCYGSGTVGRTMRQAGLVDLIWLAGATGWSGTRAVLGTDAWALFQKDLHKTWPNGAFSYDGNLVSPAFTDFGQFTPAAAPPAPAPEEESPPVVATVLMEVTARSGLRLRRGPGTEFDHGTTLPTGTIVHAIGQSGDWVEVDLEGDGRADGFMHGDFLQVVSGGFPLPLPDSARRPIDVARAELALDVREVPGSQNNPRIVMYHGSTRTGTADDEVPWCSSFVNYCVEQAGLAGTDSKWALTWHDGGWGREVTGPPEDGDIAVFRRRQGSATGPVAGGHVGFWTGDMGDRVAVLGGNQSNRVRISNYPKNGAFPGTTTFYELLSVRRP